MSNYNNHHHHFSFFKNKELNHFYLAIAIMTFGELMISLFVPIYLYELGYAVHNIIFFYFLMSLGFLIFSYVGAKVVSKVGIKHSILLSAPFLIAYFIGLNFLPDYKWLFFILPIIASFRFILYNYGYHLNYICHSDRKSRGREISFIGAIVMIIYILAPLTGGIIASQSFTLLYFIGAGLLVLGTIPLFLTKEEYEKLKFTKKGLLKKIFSKRKKGELISYSGYAIESIINVVIWPIFLITILLTVDKTGMMVTFSMIAGLVAFYFIGKMTDKFNKVKIFRYATGFYAISWIFRIFANSQLRILFIDSYKNFSQIILHVPFWAHSCDLAVKENYFAFIVRREIIFRLCRIIIMPILMLIFFINYHPFTISFIIAAVFSVGYAALEKK